MKYNIKLICLVFGCIIVICGINVIFISTIHKSDRELYLHNSGLYRKSLKVGNDESTSNANSADMLTDDLLLNRVFHSLSYNDTKIKIFLEKAIQMLPSVNFPCELKKDCECQEDSNNKSQNKAPEWIYINNIKFYKNSIHLNKDEIEALVKFKRKKIKSSHLQFNIYKEKDSELFTWQKFQNEIGPLYLYRNKSLIEELLHDVQNQPITEIRHKGGGTQLKLVIYFANGMKALWKPMRFKREQQTLPDQFYFSDFERHWAEIASFHLDRILGFHRAPPVTGRYMDVLADIKSKSKSESLSKTIFVSPAGNWCFHGKCDYYCDTTHAVCGRPLLIEGSFAVYLPDNSLIDRTVWRHPWRRSYSKKRKASWETDNKYCEEVMKTPPYNRGRRLLDVIDMSIFDFFTGNLDRHHYETFKMYDNDSYVLHLDQGKGFGHSEVDDLTILAPLYQCCFIRLSTLERLTSFLKPGKSLSSLMENSLQKDPVSPILLKPHLMTLDRRLKIILKIVNGCLETKTQSDIVVIDDGH